jgi:uncharacterized membrane protein
MRIHYAVQGHQGTMDAELVENRENKKIAWRTIGMPQITWTTSFEDLGGGRTRVTVRRSGIGMVPGALGEAAQAAGGAGGGLTEAALDELTKDIRLSLENFKQSVEAQPA